MNIKSVVIIIVACILIVLYACDGIFPYASKPTVPSDHNDNISGFFHKPNPKNTGGCTQCHGSDLKGKAVEINGTWVFANSCYQCHGNLWGNAGGGGGGNNVIK